MATFIETRHTNVIKMLLQKTTTNLCWNIQTYNIQSLQTQGRIIYHKNESVEVEHENNSLDYQPLMDVINQCEVAHLWWQWALKYLSASYEGWIKELMSSHLKDLMIKGY